MATTTTATAAAAAAAPSITSTANFPTITAIQPPHLIQSTLCLACTSIFDGATLRNEEGEVVHHALEALATRASRGCQLCLTVYMSLDPETFKSLRMSGRHLGSSELTNGQHQQQHHHDHRQEQQQHYHREACGFASITPIARDQARLKFRYVAADGMGASSREGWKSSNSNSNNSSSSPEGERNDTKGKAVVRGNNSTTARVLVTVELILMNPRYAVEPGVRMISIGSTSTASEESLKIARAWLDECSFNHMKCSVNTNVVMDSGFGVGGLVGEFTWKPTHLLDVSIKGPRGAQGVKLVDGTFLDSLSEYVTLSHVWGRQKGVRLHKGTLAALRQGVAASSLPKTFAEAAMVTLALGFRYLWIDALCIMHDSEKDALKEISMMDRIYSEAVLNIAATGAQDDTVGLIAERNVMALQPCVVSVKGLGIEDGVYKCLRSTVWQDLINSSPLVKRAWVFQERALAKRTLHFTRNELLWECQQMCCSEVFPKGLPATMKGGVRDGDVFDKRVHHQRHGNWASLVQQYSRGRLTYSGDKLLALGGLARQYMQKNRLRSSDYVCGMWKEMLPQGLLWKVDGGIRPKKWRAPSWAWTSIEGQVSFSDLRQLGQDICLEMVEFPVTTKGDDPFGQVESARLKVRGFMARGLLRRTHDYWGQGRCVIDCTNGQLELETVCFDERLPKLSAMGNHGLAEQVEVYLVPIADWIDRVEGLILCSNLKKAEFRRLGLFEVRRHDGTNWEQFKDLIKGDPRMANFEERFDQTAGHGQRFASDYTYLINLV